LIVEMVDGIRNVIDAFGDALRGDAGEQASVGGHDGFMPQQLRQVGDGGGDAVERLDALYLQQVLECEVFAKDFTVVLQVFEQGVGRQVAESVFGEVSAPVGQ